MKDFFLGVASLFWGYIYIYTDTPLLKAKGFLKQSEEWQWNM